MGSLLFPTVVPLVCSSALGLAGVVWADFRVVVLVVRKGRAAYAARKRVVKGTYEMGTF